MEVDLLKSTPCGKSLISVDCDELYGYIVIAKVALKKAVAAIYPKTS